MIANNVYMVKTWTGDTKPVKKIAMFPERGPFGDIFYKIEGQLNTDYFMISYHYDLEDAKIVFAKLLDELIKFQIDYLNDI
ncbi:MAG: hypothetical protein K0R00_3197 [Herbinix sp.]|jgi:hypothetical protein|nr:hypothetical protein [Herbinix sp.]